MKENRMTSRQLKNKLMECSQDKLINIICHLYKSNSDAALFISSEFGDTAFIEECLKNAKAKIRREFFGSGRLDLG